jgi:hypothetical protein
MAMWQVYCTYTFEIGKRFLKNELIVHNNTW